MLHRKSGKLHTCFFYKEAIYYKETKIEAQAFEAEDFINIFLRFLRLIFLHTYIARSYTYIALIYMYRFHIFKMPFAFNSKIIYQTSSRSQAGAATGLIYQKHFTVNHNLKRSLLMDSCNFNKSRLCRRYLRWTLL